MGIILSGTNDSSYYGASGDHGSYQFLTLDNVVDAFTAAYIGKGKICEGVNIADVWFHAGRALQELSYDTFKSVKSQEITLPASLIMVLPRDYVNYVKFSWSDGSGIEHIIYPTSKTSNPTDVGQDANDDYTFTGDVLDTDETSTTWENYKSANPNVDNINDYSYNDERFNNNLGQRYGIDPQHAQINGSFFIDNMTGKVHFSSNLSGKTIIIKYISDGLGDKQGGTDTNDSNQGSCLVHKFAEEAMYKHIAYGVLSAKANTPPHMLQLLKKERFAETRKAKLRLSNLKIEELTQIIRGKSKWIKH